MLTDVSDALRFVSVEVKRLGGDSSCVSLMGHSSGAHLLAMHLLLEAKREGMEASERDTEKGMRRKERMATDLRCRLKQGERARRDT